MSNEPTKLIAIRPDEVKRSRDLLGRGTYGTVYKGWWQGHEVAIKMFDGSRDVNSLQKEVSILAQCRHQNIVKLYGAWMSQNKSSHVGDLNYPFYVMEFADSGTVADVVHNKPSVHYTIGLGFSWLLQCAKAVAYLHQHQPRPIIHRDLKSMNLLLFDSGLVLKVCDFGTVREQSTDMTSSKGTVAWMAPEVLTNSRYSVKVDVYSFGIVMWEILARARPFRDIPTYRIMFHIHNGNRPPPFKDCPESLATLLANCLHQEPSRRYSMGQLVELLEIVAPNLPGFDEALQQPADEVTNEGRDPADVDIVVTEDPADSRIRSDSAAQSIMPSDPARPSDPLAQLRQVLLDDLPDKLRPSQAVPGNAESESLHNQHSQLLNGYIDEQVTLMRLTQELKDVEDQLLKLVRPDQLKQLLELKAELDRMRNSHQGAHRSHSAMELINRA